MAHLDALIDALRKLPGVGVKSAQRMAFHLLQHDRGGAQQIARALERTGSYRGYYFVLLGRLSPLDGVGTRQIGAAELLARAAEAGVEEVILATSFTAEGEATAHVLAEALKARGIASTRLARGVPVGSELEYVDLGTIAHALSDRR